MCNIWRKEKSYEMTAGQIKTIFRQLKPLRAIRITGGEPFLREDLARIVNIINKEARPEIIYITTNGTLTEKIKVFIKDVKNLHNIHIKISIDALQEEHNRIRGNENSYQKAMSALSLLSSLRQRHGFYLSVSQTIVSERCIDDYNKLREICKYYNVELYPVLAYSKPPLYETSDCLEIRQKDIKGSFFANLPLRQIIHMLELIEKDNEKSNNFIEKIAQRYYLKGLRYRLLYKKNYPNPKCAALKNYLRILPNGDVPVCLYNSLSVGNLINQPNFKKFWFEDKNIERYREQIKKCSGCWARCEVIPSSIYTGDIFRVIFG